MIDFSARETHFVDHLAPVWRALPPNLRGAFYVADNRAAARAVGYGMPVVVGWPERDKRGDPLVVAAWGDLRVCSRTRRPLVLFEHGAGQSYSNRHPSYAGGPGRERVKLFVVPNEQTAARNRRYYPSAMFAVVGCPKLDELLEVDPPSGPPTVALSFHWRADVVPETGSAIDDFGPELEKTRRRLDTEGIRLLGHSHSRIAVEARAIYTAAGIEVVDSFAEVVARAHLYAVDNSSTLFEFAALDRPVVVLNARAYRRNVEHGLRFWSEADVGLNADPGELADVILEALADPEPVARSRRAAVARVYAVTDGNSAARAASAIVSLLAPRRRACAVCGAAHCACGGPTTVVPVDQRTRESSRVSRGSLKRYPNPGRPGSFLKLSDESAKRMGLFGTAVADVAPLGPVVPMDAATNEGGAPLVSSATLAPEPERKTRPAGVPEGAMIPAGPTHRARAAAKATESPDPAPDAPETGDPQDKARPAPSRRRRRIEPEEG